jgi:DNA-binding MarR family transcriptional regulator
VTQAATSPGAPVPLARLLTLAARHLVDQLHERLRARGWRDIRPSYGYVLLACRAGRPTSVELAAVLGVSKQAAAKMVDAMVEADLLARGAAAGDGRAKPLRLTRRGRRLLEVVEEVYRELEAEWAGVIGRPAVEATRGSLAAVLESAYGDGLPPLRPG